MLPALSIQLRLGNYLLYVWPVPCGVLVMCLICLCFARRHPIRWSVGRKVAHATDKQHPVQRIISNPPFGEERKLKMEAGGEGELGYLLEGYDPEGEAVQHVFVVKVEPGSPAYRAGLFQGDAICEVDGIDVRYQTVEGIQAKIEQARSMAKLEGRR